MADINTSLPLVEPVAKTVSVFMKYISFLVGGVFGIYVLSFFYNMYSTRKLNRKIAHMMSDLKEIKRKLRSLEDKGKTKQKRSR